MASLIVRGWLRRHLADEKQASLIIFAVGCFMVLHKHMRKGDLALLALETDVVVVEVVDHHIVPVLSLVHPYPVAVHFSAVAQVSFSIMHHLFLGYLQIEVQSLDVLLHLVVRNHRSVEGLVLKHTMLHQLTRPLELEVTH